MKKLWITGVSLSIFLVPELAYAQESLVANRGKGTCWTTQKGTNGIEIFKFHTLNDAEKCGYFVAYQIPRTQAGSNIGWNGYVKIANVHDPEHSFYLGGGPFENQRPLKFGKNAEMACYICQLPHGASSNIPTNCSPNDGNPAKRAACFTGIDALNCDKQVDCSQVVDITECYQQAVGVISSSQPNDLKLCGEADRGINYGVGINSQLAITEATTQAGQISGAAAGL